MTVYSLFIKLRKFCSRPVILTASISHQVPEAVQSMSSLRRLHLKLKAYKMETYISYFNFGCEFTSICGSKIRLCEQTVGAP